MKLTESISTMQTVHFFAAFVAALVFVEATKADDRPNMIFVMSDDQGWGDVAYNGHPILKTPHNDEMASSGICFNRFYAGASVCSPTPATCLTGRNNWRMGINGPLAADEGHLPRSEITLAEVLAEHCYATGHFGKWHVGGFDTDTAGNRTKGVIETFARMSKNPIAKTAQGNSNYYPDVIYRQSSFIYWTDHISAGSNWGSDTTSTYTDVDTITIDTLTGGTDDYAVTAGELELAYDKFADTESVDVNLVLGGPSGHVNDNAAGQDTHVTMLTSLVEGRKDCVAFVSPYRAATVNIASSVTQTQNVIDAFDLCPSSSYVVFDSGYKYMYDKYNDTFRFVPMNGDVAGLCALTDQVRDAWFSPAGFNRGNVRGAVKLSYNPTQGERDQLYRARINPIVNFPGQGVVLFGDKTALSKPSAFDRINVRRLFLVLEKAIATAAKFQLFEFNDEFTRAQFRNLVEPFLRDIQGRRGITDFSVKADATNNTGEVIDRNEFVADIFIKPARSINFITLNFVAVRTGVSFTEVGG